jgi:tyrosyl-tRNA synthetase
MNTETTILAERALAERALADLPQVSLQKSHLAEGVSLAELLVLAGLAVSRDAARTLIARGETLIDDRQIDNAMERVRLPDGAVRLTAGAGQVLVRAV